MKLPSKFSAVIRSGSIAAFLSSLACLSLSAYTNLGNGVLRSDGSASDTQAAINAAANGNTVQIPSGSYTWTSGITINNKGILLKGSGSGRIVARSASSVSIGTGTKTFALFTESVASIEFLKTALVNGVTVRCEETCNTGNFVEGTVTSLSGNTLNINVTSSGGSGTPGLWIISTVPLTTITHSAGSSILIQATESTVFSVDFSGVRFLYGTGNGNIFDLGAVTGGKPILVHDCRFSLPDIGGVFIRTSANRGLIFNCSFDAATFVQSNDVCIQHKDASNSDVSASGSWTRASTMGTLDLNGQSNLYVEDCDLHGFAEGIDADDNSRIVIRDCLFDNTGLGTHGADTSTYGVRHFEFYDNEWSFSNRGAQTFNLSHWLYFRGGTGVITGNIMPDVNSGYWGNKPEIRIQVQNLQRNAGPHPLWGDNIAGAQYPCPRQFGMGRVTRAGSSDSYTYNGDPEPLYQWNNSGTGAYSAPALEDYSTPTGNQDTITAYVQIGRDWINGAKSGWVRYTYPHPLRPALPPSGAKVTILLL